MSESRENLSAGNKEFVSAFEEFLRQRNRPASPPPGTVTHEAPNMNNPKRTPEPAVALAAYLKQRKNRSPSEASRQPPPNLPKEHTDDHVKQSMNSSGAGSPTRSSRLGTRLSKFRGTASSGQRKSPYSSKPPKELTQSIILVPQHDAQEKPPLVNLPDLRARGFGLKTLHYLTSDSEDDVKKKIYDLFPVLKVVSGEIQMLYQQEKGQAKGIVPFTNVRVLSGKDLKAAKYSKVYVAPISQVNFRGARELSGAITKCLNCDNLFDDHLIVEHYEFCMLSNKRATKEGRIGGNSGGENRPLSSGNLPAGRGNDQMDQ